MATYLTNDTDLGAVADAIRAKSGGSETLVFPTGFVTEIGNISGGSGVPANDVRTIRFYKKSGAEIAVDYTQMPYSDYYNAFNGSNTEVNWTKITITPHSSAKDARGIFYCNSSNGDTALKEIIINGTLKLSVTAQGSSFGNRKGLKTITGLLSLASVTRADWYSGTNNANGFYNCTALETVSFVPGTMPVTSTNWVLSWLAALTDDSLVSIANALKDTYAGTITFHATPKGRLSTIMGSVTNDGTLSTFAIDASGTVSLEGFLTTIKGATLA